MCAISPLFPASGCRVSPRSRFSTSAGWTARAIDPSCIIVASFARFLCRESQAVPVKYAISFPNLLIVTSFTPFHSVTHGPRRVKNLCQVHRVGANHLKSGADGGLHPSKGCTETGCYEYRGIRPKPISFGEGWCSIMPSSSP